MITLIGDKIEKITQACSRYGVAHLYLFGSALRNDFREGESDLDFLVEFIAMDSYQRVEAYFGLREELQSLFGTTIDLVMVGAVKNRYIAAEIERTRQVIYAA